MGSRVPTGPRSDWIKSGQNRALESKCNRRVYSRATRDQCAARKADQGGS
ncbi:hypothetical protein DDY07_07365 [Methylomonas sp. ZR1]|nr:hypothetical protein [Methylomonas sp. ZR1]